MKTFDRTVIYNGKIIDLEIHDVELPDGKTSKREIIKHNGAVAICAITPEKKYYWLNNIVNLLKTLVRNSSR